MATKKVISGLVSENQSLHDAIWDDASSVAFGLGNVVPEAAELVSVRPVGAELASVRSVAAALVSVRPVAAAPSVWGSLNMFFSSDCNTKSVGGRSRLELVGVILHSCSNVLLPEVS